MAQAIKAVQVTRADELRELLILSEKRVVNAHGSGADVLALLQGLDRISELWPELEAQGVDLRPEAGRWETLQAAIQRNAPRLVAAAQAVGGLPAARAQHHPDDEAAWWWFLAEQVRKQRARSLTRTGLIVGGVAVVAILLYVLIFRVLFPVDPAFIAAVEAQNAGEAKLAAQSDYAGALVDFRRASELRPGDPEAWLQVGCVLLKLEDPAAAQENFRRAEVLMADPPAYLLARASICLQVGVPDVAEADLRAVIASDPENAQAYYQLATIFEARGAINEALAALERVSVLAERHEDTELMAMTRVRMGLLMQQMVGGDVPAATPTP